MNLSNNGFLLHAINNQIDYGLMALCCALLIKKSCKTNNIALITCDNTYQNLCNNHSESLISKAFDHIKIITTKSNVNNRTFFDTKEKRISLPYHNYTRLDSFDLTPWDETILLDADFLTLDNTFDLCWNSYDDFKANWQINELNSKVNHTRITSTGPKLFWATCIYFKKTQFSRTVFELMKFIKENYIYYHALYKLPTLDYYRNDYSLSIALHMLNSQSESDIIKSLPNPAITVASDTTELISFNDGNVTFLSEDQSANYKLHKIFTNVHVMNKFSLLRNSKQIIEYATKN